MKHSEGSLFSHSLRIKTSSDQKSRIANPGPGSYRLNTDFGYYEKSIKSVQHTVQ